MNSSPEIRLGTSSFTAPGWNGPFYPRGIKASERLAFYAAHFDTVEIDSTFYACPSTRTVAGWAAKTPEGFLFSVKVPRIVTHDKVLADCHPELSEFLRTMSLLGSKLGPLVFQFPFFNRGAFQTRDDFFHRLIPFLKELPPDFKFAIEIRNNEWIDARYASLLRDFRVALVLPDRSGMSLPAELSQTFDPITADWTYIRWLGDRAEIELITTAWEKIIVDRAGRVGTWVDYCHRLKNRGVTVYAYANNHYAGFAPGTIRQFREVWNRKGFPPLPLSDSERTAPTLFDL